MVLLLVCTVVGLRSQSLPALRVADVGTALSFVSRFLWGIRGPLAGRQAIPQPRGPRGESPPGSYSPRAIGAAESRVKVPADCKSLRWNAVADCFGDRHQRWRIGIHQFH